MTRKVVGDNFVRFSCAASRICHHDGGVLRRQLVMDTFGISIPGLRIAGGLIVAFIGFRMLFRNRKRLIHRRRKASEELKMNPSANIAFVPLAMPKYRWSGNHSDDY